MFQKHRVILVLIAAIGILSLSACQTAQEEETYVSVRKDKEVETAFDQVKEEETEVANTETAKTQTPTPPVTEEPETEEEEPVSYRVTADVLNLRNARNQTAPVLLEIRFGSLVSVSEIDGEWAEVTYDDTEGYVRSEWLQEVDMMEAKAFRTDILSSQFAGAYPLGELRRGDQVEVVDRFNFEGTDWVRVLFEGIEGYVPAENLE
ncbi:MAG: SH3 domain-containing protein [Tissierellia bacterium]|nr:SH3 domain-containing protein [Tissierellia bacterium]